MKKTCECRYFVTDIVAVPIVKLYRKSEAYRQATIDGWGVVYTDKDNELVCDEDSYAILIPQCGQQSLIFPYNELNKKEWLKQEECIAIIQGDSCGFSFWEKEKGDIQIFVTYDENRLIDSYRITDWTDKPYDNEILIDFESLSEIDPYSKY
ncbi:MAG TPA: hypothetical protein VIK86_07930 [Candidatus Paceibacterota bacterium]